MDCLPEGAVAPCGDARLSGGARPTGRCSLGAGCETFVPWDMNPQASRRRPLLRKDEARAKRHLPFLNERRKSAVPLAQIARMSRPLSRATPPDLQVGYRFRRCQEDKSAERNLGYGFHRPFDRDGVDHGSDNRNRDKGCVAKPPYA